jgi:hypothetical protein
MGLPRRSGRTGDYRWSGEGKEEDVMSPTNDSRVAEVNGIELGYTG